MFNIKQVAWAWVLIIVVNDNYYFWFFKLGTVWFTFIIHLMQRLLKKFFTFTERWLPKDCQLRKLKD